MLNQKLDKYKDVYHLIFYSSSNNWGSKAFKSFDIVLLHLESRFVCIKTLD